MKTLAYNCLATSTSVENKAIDYSKSIKRSVKFKKIEPLKHKIEGVKSKIKELEDMSLETDNNKGLLALTKSQCEDRFIQAMDLRVELEDLELEYDAVKKSFKHYFGKQNDEKVKDKE